MTEPANTAPRPALATIAGPFLFAYVVCGAACGHSANDSAGDASIRDGSIRDGSIADARVTTDAMASDGTSADASIVVAAPTYQQAYVKASNPNAGDDFGATISSIAISNDGNTLAVGAWLEASAATGINGDQFDNSSDRAGAVYVYTRSGTTWTQQAYVKASNTGSGDFFGVSVALSGDGNTLAIGAECESSAATGIDGDQSDDSAPAAGAVYVFARSGSSWAQAAYIKASNTNSVDYFGASVSLSSDGNTLVAGAPFESSAATGINGNESDNSASASGAAYVFTRSGATWTQQAYVKASNPNTADQFGYALDVSDDGNTLVVGATRESSAATGIDGDQADNSAFDAGAAYVFVRSASTWSQQAYVKASNTNAMDGFGFAVAASSDGDTLVVGAPFEASAATGIAGDQSDNSAGSAGAAYVFTRSGTTWSQQAYVKASNTAAGDAFGVSVAVGADGDLLAVGATLEPSAATGINGDQTNRGARYAGASYVFARSGTTWAQAAYVKASNTDASDEFGTSIGLANDSGTLVVGAWGEASAATGINGDQSDNSAPSAGAAYVFQ